MKIRILLVLVIFYFVVLLAGCSSAHQSIVIGIVPYNNPTEVVDKFKPIKDYLQKEMGVAVEVVVSKDYLGLISAVKKKKVDIGLFGPFSYISGESEVKLEPLVVQYRKGTGTNYCSMIIARRDSGIKAIEDLRGKKFTFVDPGSTSGYVIPYALFKSRNINIQEYFKSIKFSGTHDSVCRDVINGSVDAGAMDDIVFNHMLSSGKLIKEDIIIIWKSESIPGSPYVARADVDKKVKDRFKEAMLAIHEKAPDALKSYNQNAEKYVECDRGTYNSIRNTASILGKDFIIDNFLKNK